MRRWVGYIVFVIVFAVACTMLSMWQFARSEEARLEVDRVTVNWDAEPEPLASVLGPTASFDPDTKWVPVEVTGEYLADEQILVRSRPYDGRPGFAVVVPFLTDEGTVFAIDRGWVPQGSAQDSPDVVPAPPEGHVSVVARLKAGEPELPGRSAPEGQLASIHLPAIAELVGDATYTSAYGVLDSETPAVDPRPFATRKPAADEGPHLSYALQWILFGVLAFIGLAWAVRHDYRQRHAQEPEEMARAAARAEKVARKGPTDADVEDEILDSISR